MDAQDWAQRRADALLRSLADRRRVLRRRPGRMQRRAANRVPYQRRCLGPRRYCEVGAVRAEKPVLVEESVVLINELPAIR